MLDDPLDDDLYQTDESDLGETPEDAIEAPNNAESMYHPAQDQEKLPQDYETPAAPAPPSAGGTRLPPDHPEYDYDRDQDEHERYDEGRLGATDVDAHEEVSPPAQILPLEPQDGTDRKAET